MDNKKKKKSKSKKPAQQEVKPQQKHIVFEDVDVPKVVEPKPTCSICGESIEAIIEAISEPDGSYSHFDCVLKKITEQERVVEPDKVSYIGHGTFAVVTPDEKGSFSIKYRVPYENTESYLNMKKYVEDIKE